MPRKFMTIRGRRNFQHHLSGTDKRWIQKRAKTIRQAGYLVRVTKKKVKNKSWYSYMVWSRRKGLK